MFCQNQIQGVEHHPTVFLWAPSAGNVFNHSACLLTQWNALTCRCRQTGKCLACGSLQPNSVWCKLFVSTVTTCGGFGNYQHSVGFCPAPSDYCAQTTRLWAFSLERQDRIEKCQDLVLNIFVHLNTAQQQLQIWTCSHWLQTMLKVVLANNVTYVYAIVRLPKKPAPPTSSERPDMFAKEKVFPACRES